MPRLGKYELVRKLDAGGMAEIYLARQEEPEALEKTVVLKRLHSHLAANKNVVEMFINEARIASRLHHPNIVHIFDLGFSGLSYFLAMEHVWGHNLQEVFEQGITLRVVMPHGLVSYIVSQVCCGLHYAHTFSDEEGRNVGIVHRDVSPQNVLIGFNGEVKLADFGIAQAATLAAETHAGLLKGKFPYMSPEQCRGETLDARSDIFSVGILLYELTCRRRLFRRHNEVATMRAIVEDPIPLPSKVVGDVPQDLERIIMRALARAPEDRYQDAQQIQSDLERVMEVNGWQISAEQAAGHMAGLFPEELKHDGAQKKPAFFDVPTMQTELDPDGQDDFYSAPTAPTTPPFDITIQPIARGKGVDKGGAQAREDGHRPVQEDDPTEVWLKIDQAEVVIQPEDLQEISPPEIPEPPKASLRTTSTEEHFTEVPTETLNHQDRPAARADDAIEEAGVSVPSLSEPIGSKPATSRQPAAVPTISRAASTMTNRKLVAIVAAVFALLLVALGALIYRLVITRSTLQEGGMVEVKTDPPGATVFLNSKKQFETTPTTIHGVPLARKNLLVLIKEGYSTYVKRFILDENQPSRTLSIKLERAGVGGPAATLVVQVSVEGAKVFLNGELKGSAPLSMEELASGVGHVLVIKKDGYDEKKLDIKPLAPRERRTVHVDLHPSDSRLKQGVRGGRGTPGREGRGGPVEVPQPKVVVPPLEDMEVGERVPRRPGPKKR